MAEENLLEQLQEAEIDAYITYHQINDEQDTQIKRTLEAKYQALLKTIEQLERKLSA